MALELRSQEIENDK